MLERQRDDPRPEADAGGARGRVRQEDERRGQTSLLFVEVMLSDPHRIEPGALGVGDLSEGEPVPLGGGGVVEHAGEEPDSLDGHEVVSF